MRLASLGAIQKFDETFRAAHDATHGVAINGCIQVRDQIAGLIAGDVKEGLRTLEQPTFLLTTDDANVKRAQTLAKIKPSEWGQQARPISETSPYVWLNTVGTFGVASAAVHCVLAPEIDFVYLRR